MLDLPDAILPKPLDATFKLAPIDPSEFDCAGGEALTPTITEAQQDACNALVTADLAEEDCDRQATYDEGEAEDLTAAAYVEDDATAFDYDDDNATDVTE